MDASIFADMAKKTTKKWTKQRKAEERAASSLNNRLYAMTRSYRVTIKDVAYAYMEKAYMKASANGTLPAVARQIMYAARGHILQKTEEESLDGAYFQGLLKDYMVDYPSRTASWDVVFDSRGNFHEPHTKEKIPIGTLAVRNYLHKVRSGLKALDDSPPDVMGESYPTIGSENRFSALLFIEKEGFMPLLEKADLAKRYDIAIMSTKGMSTIASRMLVDELCADVPLLIVRDFDKAGFSIASTIQRDSKHYRFRNRINVIDLGLRLEDAENWELESEPVYYNSSSRTVRSNLRKNGATAEEIDFLCAESDGHWNKGAGERIELNAFASDQFIDWLEEKLMENGVEKVIPNSRTLEDAYRHAYKLARYQKLIDKHADEISKEVEQMEIPDDLEEKISDIFDQNDTTPWDTAINEIASEDADEVPEEETTD